MPIKKSDLYSALRASCDDLRGGMNASRNMDYFLFIKHISNPRRNSDGKTQ